MSSSIQLISTLYNFLNSGQVVVGSGFMLGCIYNLKFCKETLEHPYYELFWAALYGLITMFEAILLSIFIPHSCFFMISVIALASCIYYKYEDLTSGKKLKRY